MQMKWYLIAPHTYVYIYIHTHKHMCVRVCTTHTHTHTHRDKVPFLFSPIQRGKRKILH